MSPASVSCLLNRPLRSPVLGSDGPLQQAMQTFKIVLQSNAAEGSSLIVFIDLVGGRAF